MPATMLQVAQLALTSVMQGTDPDSIISSAHNKTKSEVLKYPLARRPYFLATIH